MRIDPLNSYNITVHDVDYKEWGLVRYPNLFIGESIIPAVSPAVEMHLRITDWRINGEAVTKSNWQADELGGFDIDKGYWGQWSIS